MKIMIYMSTLEHIHTQIHTHTTTHTHTHTHIHTHTHTHTLTHTRTHMQTNTHTYTSLLWLHDSIRDRLLLTNYVCFKKEKSCVMMCLLNMLILIIRDMHIMLFFTFYVDMKMRVSMSKNVSKSVSRH